MASESIRQTSSMISTHLAMVYDAKVMILLEAAPTSRSSIQLLTRGKTSNNKWELTFVSGNKKEVFDSTFSSKFKIKTGGTIP